MDSSHARSQRTYDYRLRDLVRTAGDPDIVAELGVPRSTALGWLGGEYGPVVTTEILDRDTTKLQAEVLKLRRRVRMLAALVRLLVALLRASAEPATDFAGIVLLLHSPLTRGSDQSNLGSLSAVGSL